MNYSFFYILSLALIFPLFSEPLIDEPLPSDNEASNQKDSYSSCCSLEKCSSTINEADCCCNDDTEDWDSWIYPNYFYLGQTEGRGLGYRRGYTTLGLFLAPSMFATSRFQLFLDAKAYHFNGGKWASSIGLGTRHILYSNNIVLGLNAYYDSRKIHRFNFNQVGIGIELLGPFLDIRINGYIPVGRKNVYEGRLFDFSDNFIAIRRREISSWYGIDAEIGTWLKRKYACDWLGLYFAVGPYYYARNHKRHFEDGNHHQAFGGRGRLLARIGSMVDLSVIATYDPIWHTRVQGQLTLTIPFDCYKTLFNQRLDKCSCKTSPCLLRQIATQPVQRNGIIVVDQKCCWLWNWSDCGCASSNSNVSSHSVSLSQFSDFWDSSSHSSSSSDSFDFSSDFFDHVRKYKSLK